MSDTISAKVLSDEALRKVFEEKVLKGKSVIMDSAMLQVLGGVLNFVDDALKSAKVPNEGNMVYRAGYSQAVVDMLAAVKAKMDFISQYEDPFNDNENIH